MNKYNKYKSSGVEWIGEIPSHWDFIKTNILTENLDGKRVPLNSEERGEMEGEYPYWGSNGIVDYVNKFIFNEEIVLVGEDGSPFFDRFKNVSFYVNEPVWVNNHIHILKPKEKILPKYLTHSFNCVDYKEYITGSTRDKLTQSDLKRISHCVPPIQEQHQIVQFLDEKTELIERLISTKERKITILKEQRTSLINQVVTKGLNPNVKMKDSGVEWIGEIPEHWKSCNLRYILDLLTDFESNGSFSSVKENVKVDDEGEVWYVRMTDLENNNIRNENCKYCDLDTYNFLHKTKVYGGELLITKRGEIGKVYLFPYNCGLSTLGPNSYLLRLKNIVNSHFLYFFYKSDIGQTTLKLLDNSTTIGSLYKDDIKGSSVIVPPIDEQHQIVEYLGSKTKEIDDLVQLEQKKINLLKEYRLSLISEVVTGKIKVTTDE
jgi:type I restriction enzyme S subunit